MKMLPCRQDPGTCARLGAGCHARTTTDGGERASPTENALGSIHTRRGVVRRAVLGVAGLGLVGVAAGCGPDEADEPAARLVTVPPADVPPVDGEPYRSETGTFYLVHNQDGILAFSWRCTHQGCEVPWEEDEQRFHCPCHGSVFDRNGVNVSGPARRPLDLVELEVRDSGDVVVAASETRERSGYEGDQAVPYPAAGAAMDAGAAGGNAERMVSA